MNKVQMLKRIKEDDRTMYLDRTLAKKLLLKEVKKEGKKIVEACLVLAGDESWNNETIYKDGKNVNQKDWKCFFASYWAVPTLVIYYKDGKEKRLPAYFIGKDYPKRAFELQMKEKKEFKKSMACIRKTLSKTKKTK